LVCIPVRYTPILHHCLFRERETERTQSESRKREERQRERGREIECVGGIETGKHSTNQ
jgi:hypothetical protein